MIPGDLELARLCNRLGAGVIDPFTEAFCSVVVLLVLWAALTALVLGFDPAKRRTVMVALGIALAAHLLINEAVLKHLLLLVRPIRLRPFVAHPGEIVCVGYPFKDSSFPSSHAASTAVFATIFGYHYRQSLPLGVGLVLLMAFCRVHNGMHYPSDVLSGSCLGVLYGALGLRGAASLRKRAASGGA